MAAHNHIWVQTCSSNLVSSYLPAWLLTWWPSEVEVLARPFLPTPLQLAREAHANQMPETNISVKYNMNIQPYNYSKNKCPWEIRRICNGVGASAGHHKVIGWVTTDPVAIKLLILLISHEHCCLLLPHGPIVLYMIYFKKNNWPKRRIRDKEMMRVYGSLCSCVRTLQSVGCTYWGVKDKNNTRLTVAWAY